MPEMEDYHFEGSMNDDPKMKLRKLMNKFGPRKMGGLIATLVVAIMLPVTLIAMQQQQNIKQRASTVWSDVKTIPGNIGINRFERPDSSNQYFEPLLVDYSGSMHVFVIGEGGSVDNPGNKPRGEWYQLYVSSTDQPAVDWGGYQLLEGNSSSAPEFKKEGDNLKIRVRGLSSSTSGPEYTTFYSKTRGLLSGFGGWVKDESVGWSGITPGEQREVRFTDRNGVTKLYRAITRSGQVVIQAKDLDVQQPGGTATPTPRPNTPPSATPTPNLGCINRSGNCAKVDGSSRSATRCSASLGCTRAYYDPKTQNSCGDPKDGTVAYAQEVVPNAECNRPLPVPPGRNDELNAPCHINDDNNPYVISPGEKAALKTFYETNSVTNPNYRAELNNPTLNAYCGAQSGAAPIATSTPRPTATPTTLLCAGSQPKWATRCSFNYANARAQFLTSNRACNQEDMNVAVPLPYPADPKICYITDTTCPSTYQGKQLPARNGKQQCVTTPTPTQMPLDTPVPTRSMRATPTPG